MAPPPHPPLDDYYALLGVRAGADGAELRRAWRRLAARYHPDRAGDAGTATFQRLAAAYEILADPLARAAYDRRRRQATCSSAAPAAKPAHHDAPAQQAAPGRRSAPAVMLSRLCGHLSTLLACGAARDDADGPGLITLVLRPDEAAQGGMATISLRVALWCPDCSSRAGKPRAACARCGGTGTVDELFSAWLAVPPGVSAGEVLVPSADLPGMVEPVRFRVGLAGMAR